MVVVAIAVMVVLLLVLLVVVAAVGFCSAAAAAAAAAADAKNASRILNPLQLRPESGSETSEPEAVDVSTEEFHVASPLR